MTPAAARDHIFISYRRDDARGASGRLYDWLRIAFGRDQVFRDVHSIGVGKWREKIDGALARSAVCVAVIGLRWVNARLFDHADMVRHELLKALADGQIKLVPTLVEGAAVPNAAALPPELRALFDVWNALPVTEVGWEDDTRRLIAAIAEAAGFAAKPDVDTLLRDVAAAQQRVAELEQARNLQEGQIDGLRRTVEDLTRRLAEAPANERSGLAEAFAALARGDSLAAENAFEREYEAQSHTTAEAARNVANLALLRDVTKAVRFYRKALDLEPEHTETARLLGSALVLLGDLKGAEAAFLGSLNAAIKQHDSWGEMAAQIGLGDVFQRIGNLEAAAASYRRALRLAQQHLEGNPANAQRLRDVSVCHDRIGDVLVAQGDGKGALAAYRQSLTIREELAKRDPANTERQRDLSISHNKIGNVLVAQGDGPGALAAYRHSLTIHEGLAKRDPANTQWQRDLSVSHNKIGDVLVAQGDGPGALAAYRQSLTISEGLAKRDPANTLWERDLIVSFVKLGAVTGDKAYSQKALDIAVAMQQRGTLTPRDSWMVDDLKRRAGH